MSDICTLEQLRDHAAKNADKEYRLGSCKHCLAAELTGRVMYDHYTFEDPDATVPEAFGDLCKYATWGRPYHGSSLAKAIEELIGGTHGSDAAFHLDQYEDMLR